MSLFIKKKAFTIIFAVICACFLPSYLNLQGIGYTNSLVPFAVAAGIYMLLSAECRVDVSKRLKKYTFSLGLVFSCFTSFGNYLENGENLPFLSLPMWFSILLYAWVYSAFLVILWSKLQQWEISLQNTAANKSLIFRIANYILNRSWLIALILFVCWLPAYLAVFPGDFIYDAHDEINQLYYGFRDDFPKLHSAIITQLLNWSDMRFGSYAVGMVIYSVIQLCVVSLIYSHMLGTFQRRGINPVLLLAIIAFLAFFPVYAMSANNTGRDMLFTTLLFYSIFLVYLLCIETKRILGRLMPSIGIGVILALTILSRNNSMGHLIIAVIVLLLLFFCFKMRHKYLKGAIALSCSLITCYISVNLLVAHICTPCPPFQYMGGISLFTQAVCRSYHIDSWTPEEKAEFNELVDIEKAGYVAENADSSKFCIPPKNYKGDNYNADLVKFWFKIWKEHPATYPTAWIINSRSFWYPSVVIDGYNEFGVYEKYDKSYFAYALDHKDTVSHPGHFPAIKKFYHNIGVMLSFEKIPFLSMVFSIGFQYWILLNAMFYVCYRRCKRIKIPLAILLAYTCILYFVPLIIVRYFFVLFYLLPMVYVFTLQPLKSGD